jgi:hypothetical protein
MGKHRGECTARRLLMAFVWCAFVVSFPAPAFAITKQVYINVNVEGFLDVAYTGPSLILFDVNSGDLSAGSKALLDQGDLNSCSNTAPWIIRVQRTEWHTPNQSVDPGLILQVKYGPGSTGDWVTVNKSPTAWISGSTIGHSTFQGVDWMINGLNTGMNPGMYYCTVTISIIGG